MSPDLMRAGFLQIGNPFIGNYDPIFTDASGLHSSAPKSTAFVEALWRRRAQVPVTQSCVDLGYSATLKPASNSLITTA